MIFSCICTVGFYSSSFTLRVNYQWFTVSARALTAELCGCMGPDQANCTAFLLTGEFLLLTTEMADGIIRVWRAWRWSYSLMLILCNCRSHLSGRFWGPNLPPIWQILSIFLDYSLCFFCQLERQESLFFMHGVSSLKGEHVFLCFMLTAT